jgi:Ribbon-helix-helix protein, copG family
MTDTSPILGVLPSRCPSRRIGLELPLATIEELDLLVDLQHLSREQILRQIIKAALLSDAPHWPTSPDPIGRLAEHAYLTLVRSYELAGEPKSEATSSAQSQQPDAGSSCR